MKPSKENPKSVKIEGAAFERIKEKAEAHTAVVKELLQRKETAHKELWDLIHQEFPEFDRDANMTLDTEYGDLGFYVLKEKDGCTSGLLSALKAAIK